MNLCLTVKINLNSILMGVDTGGAGNKIGILRPERLSH